MKNESTRKVINVDKPNYVPLFEFKELDNAVIRLSLFKASVEFDITGQTVKLGAKTSKGLKEQSEGFTINKNNLDIDLKNSILVPGTVEIDLELKDASGTMTTASFFITVKSKVLNDKAVEGTNEFDTFTKTAAKIEEDYKGLRRIIIDENQAANLQDQVNQTNAHLDTKVNKEYVDSNLNKKFDITYKMEPENCSQNLLNLVTGNSQVNLLSIPQDNSVTLDKIVDGTLTSKFNFKSVINKLDENNFALGGGSITEIIDGVKITQTSGSWFKMVLDISNFDDGDYEFTFSHKATGTVGDWAGFIKLYSSSGTTETSKSLSSYGTNTLFNATFTKKSNMTKFEYMVLTSGTSNFEIEITNIEISTLQKLDNVILNQNKTIKDIKTFLDDINIKVNIIEVSHDFTSSTVGYSTTKFSNLIDAHNYTNNKSNYYNRYIIKVHPGHYKEWETVWSGFDSSVNYRGIRINDYVYFESTDITKPENYILEWDGYVGCDRTMTTSECMQKCLFHIDKRPTHTHIKGFHLKSKNTRYCIHPETASTGAGNEWLIENCIIEFEGRPNCEVEGGMGIGIGISMEEKGFIKNCKFADNGKSGIGGHNNGWSTMWQGEVPFMAKGAELTIENCDLGNNNIYMQTTNNTAKGYDLLNVINCSNVSEIKTKSTVDGVPNKWRVKKEYCDAEITTI